MPLYVYEPTVYSHDSEVSECCYFESLQSLGEEPLARCPTCGHEVHRAVTAAGYVVRGGGPSKADIVAGGIGAGGATTSQGGRAARLAARHVCGMGCRH
jgi:putative FmdB family regulatory protein